MKTKFTLWKRAARSVLLILLLCAAGLTKSFAQEWEWQTLTVNDGTDENVYVPFNGQFNGELPTYSQFIIPASDLSDMAWGNIHSITFSCNYEEGGGEWLREIPDWSDGLFEVRIAEVDFDKFESSYNTFELYDWDLMTVVYEGGLSVSDHQLTINLGYYEYDEWMGEMIYVDYYHYEGENLLIGIKPISVSYNYYNGCSWSGIYEDGYDAWSYDSWVPSEYSDQTPTASLTYFRNHNGHENVTVPNQFMPKVTFNFEPGYVPSCLKPQNVEADEIMIHNATISWTGEAQFFNLQYKKSSEEWGHYGSDEFGNWVWIEGGTTVEGLTESQYTLEGLESQTSYDVRVKAVCSAWQYGDEWYYDDVSDWSRTFTFSTIKPMAPIYFHATDFDTSVGDSVTLRWGYDYDYYYSENWEPPTYWDIAYTTNMDALPDEIGYVTINSDSLPDYWDGYYYELSGLVSFASYKAWIRASFGNGDVSDWSGPITFMPTNLTNSISVNNGNNHMMPACYRVPFYSNASKSRSQFIIPASLLTDLANHEICRLDFRADYLPALLKGTIEIYLIEVDEEVFTNPEYYDWESMHKVFDGSFDIAASYSGYTSYWWYGNPLAFTFDSPYFYEGGNLLIGIKASASSNGYTVYWNGIQTDNNTALAGGWTGSPTQYAFLPKTTIYYTSNSCQSPHDLVATVSEDDTSVTLSWAGEGENYRLCYWSQTDMTPNYVEVTGTSYELTNLPRSTYSWSVQTLCGEDETSPFVQGPSFLNVLVREPQFHDNIYEVYTPGELIWVERVVNGTITEGTEGVFPTGNTSMEGLTVRLMNDIDLHDIKWRPIGYYNWDGDWGNNALYFNGTFDGNNHVITNLYVNQPNDQGVGLFGALGSNGEIHSVGIEGESSITGKFGVGGVVGFSSWPGSTMWNVFCNATVIGKEYVGGIVGYCGSTINQAYFSGTVTVDATDPMEISGLGSGYSIGYCGGITGYGGNINNTYNRGVVTSLMGPAGGISGGYASISNSYSTGVISSDSGQGGAIYGVGYEDNCSNNYFLEGQYDHQEGGTSKTQQYMQSNWLVYDLNRGQSPQPWKADYTPNTNDGYPILQWQDLSFTVMYTYPEHGSLTVMNGSMMVSSGTRVAGGTVLTVTAEPYYGYILESLTANGQNINNNTLVVNESVQIEAVFVPQPLGEFTSLSPADNQAITAMPVNFSWTPVPGAQLYDVYIWNSNDTAPNQPYVFSLTSAGYNCYTLENHQTYQWYVRARNVAYQTTSAIRSFSLDAVPTLTVNPTQINFGEVELDDSILRTVDVNGMALEDSLSVQLVGNDADMFSYAMPANWNPYSGGVISVTFHPTTMKNSYHSTLIISSGTLTKSVELNGSIVNPFVFTTIVDDSIFLIGDTIPIHGTVKDNHNVPAANVDVEVGVTVFGYRRTLETVSDENGEFAVDFIPSLFESGYYTVNSGPIGNADTTAVHDDFDILGMMIGFVENGDDTIQFNGYIVCEVTQNEPPKPFVLPIKNKNSIALTNLQVEIISEQPEGSVFNFGTLNLAGFEFGYLPFTVAGTIPTQGDGFQEFMVRITSNEGSKMEYIIMYYCHEAMPELSAYPNPIVTTVTRGTSKSLDVTLTNNGTVATGEITVNLPDLEWMSVMGGNVLPSIDANSSSIFTLRLLPSDDVPLGPYEGTIVINASSGVSTTLHYTITVVSEDKGTLLVDVTDEFTTNTNNGNGPHVEGAEVTLTGFYSHEVAAHGFTGPDGTFEAGNILEGWYWLDVTAERHSEYRELVYFLAGITNRYDVFLEYQGVYYTWLVEETEIIDEYEVELNAVYEVDVPLPVVTITSNPSSIPAFGTSYDFNYVITNHGLIDATDLVIIPENEDYYLTPLFTHIDTLHAHQSIVVPCRVTHKDPEDCGNWEKTVVQYKYLSGQIKRSKSSFTYTCIGGQPCDDELPYFGGGGGSGSGYGSGFGIGYPTPRPRPRPHEPNHGDDPYNNIPPTPHVTHQHQSVPVRIGMQFSHNLTMTREAFIGTFIVHNMHETNATTDIGLDLTVKDELGIDHSNLFEISLTSLEGIDAIDGTGTVNAASNGTVKIQFIPTRDAAPTEPVDYYFGGNFTFTDPWTSISYTMHLYPTKLTVHPSPDLHIDYFVSPILYGDNPLTPNVIEPSIPTELAVRIENVGVGTAKNVMIETAEPIAVNNVQNLLIDIELIGTYLEGDEDMQLGLHNIDFGNIESGQKKIGEWLFTSSLLAHLVSGNVHLVHNDIYGNPRLSLVSHVGIHELTHPIYGSRGTRADGAHDFLVNDIPDENNYPDSIFFAGGGKSSVSVVESMSFDKYVTAHDTIVTLTVNPSRVGWNYGEVEDPGRNHYELVSCTRNNDNQDIPLSNIWQETMLVPNSGDSLYANKLRIVDTLSVVQPTTYTLVFAGDPNAPYVFFGDEDEYWSNAANWEGNAKPLGNNNNVLIDGICQLDEDAAVSSLTIAEGKSLTIPEDRILTVSGDLTSTVASALIIEEDGQLMHTNTGAQGLVQKTIMPYTTNVNGWYLIASPLVGNTAVTTVNNMLSNNYDLYYYDEPTYYWMNQKFAANNFTELENGKGYLYANSEEVTLGFAGELQDGSATVNVPLSYTPNISLSGFNLVGNPYAHNVVSYASVNVANGCYQMNEDKSDLIVSEISEAYPLKPAEGFFVKATGENASVTFNPGRGTTTSPSGSIRVELSDKGKLIDRLIVKTDGQMLEKLSLSEQRTKIFAQGEGQEQAIVPCEGNEQPINFKAAKNGTYSINVNTNNMEFDYLHLIDNLTGADVDLLVEPSYSFEACTSDYASRFKLIFLIREDSATDGSETFAFFNGNEWFIRNEGRATLQVIDMTGRILSNESVNGSCSKHINQPAGIYMLRLINGNDVKVQKIVVR